MEPGKNPYGNAAKKQGEAKIDPKNFPANKKPGESIPTVKAEVVVPKAKRQNNLKRAIFSADVNDFKSFIVYDWLIPFVKSGLMDMLSRMLFNQPYSGTPGRRVGSSAYWSGTKTRDQGLRDVSHDFIFDTSQEAQEVLEGAKDWCNRTGTITIADFCRIAGLIPDPGDLDYGWYNFSGSRVVSYGDSWVIEMPRARRL